MEGINSDKVNIHLGGGDHDGGSAAMIAALLNGRNQDSNLGPLVAAMANRRDGDDGMNGMNGILGIAALGLIFGRGGRGGSAPLMDELGRCSFRGSWFLLAGAGQCGV